MFFGVGSGDESGVRMLIAGNAKFEQTPEGTFVTYYGECFKSTPEKPIAVTGTASAAHAADWSDDGLLDVLVGEFAKQKPDLSDMGRCDQSVTVTAKNER